VGILNPFGEKTQGFVTEKSSKECIKFALKWEFIFSSKKPDNIFTYEE
jgi:hypothetical protein